MWTFILEGGEKIQIFETDNLWDNYEGVKPQANSATILHIL